MCSTSQGCKQPSQAHLHCHTRCHPCLLHHSLWTTSHHTHASGMHTALICTATCSGQARLFRLVRIQHPRPVSFVVRCLVDSVLVSASICAVTAHTCRHGVDVVFGVDCLQGCCQSIRPHKVHPNSHHPSAAAVRHHRCGSLCGWCQGWCRHTAQQGDLLVCRHQLQPHGCI